MAEENFFKITCSKFFNGPLTEFDYQMFEWFEDVFRNQFNLKRAFGSDPPFFAPYLNKKFS